MRMRLPFNIRGDLFATGICFAGQAAIRLLSSLILTRLLVPEAYGIITVLLSVLAVLELIGDFSVTAFIVRDKNAEQPSYLNTAWTMRFCRALVNGALMFSLAPFVSTTIYHLPALINPLRVFSLWFLFSGLESMSFAIAIRRKQTRIVMYSELAATFITTCFTVAYCFVFRDFWGLVFGTLLNRLVYTAISYQFYKDLRPRFHYDKTAARDLLGYSKYLMPSSLLTLAISQIDKIVFLRLFSLQLLGAYGLASNIAGAIEGLITKTSAAVLYSRCAHNYRLHPESYALKYYKENIRLFVSIMFLPAAIGGAAQLVVSLLYPAGYTQTAVVLKALMLRAGLLSIALPAEDMLVATGEYKVILAGNVLKAVGLLIACVGGYLAFGFVGFVFGVGMSPALALVYYLWLQRKRGYLIVRYELYRGAFIVTVALIAYLGSILVQELRHHWSA